MQLNRYAHLDGIRGIAAIFVLTRHTGYFWNFSLYRSYLAVDLFFILSGFVIANSYDEKIRTKSISIVDFFIIRIVRLYPIFILSCGFCILTLIWKIIFKNNFSNINEILSIIILSIFLFPSKMTGDNSLFPINGPYWSLFFEIISNIIYAAIRPFLNSFLLATIVMLFGTIVSIGAVNNGNLDIGFGWGITSNIMGFSRSMFGIFFGLMLHRHMDFFSKYLKKISPWFSILSIVLILTSPNVKHFNSIIDIISVIIIFPICVLLSAKSLKSKIDNVFVLLGSASYPIYVLHKPFGEIVNHFLKENYTPFIGIIFTIMLIIFSVFIEKFYDIPLRRYIYSNALKNKRKDSFIPIKS